MVVQPFGTRDQRCAAWNTHPLAATEAGADGIDRLRSTASKKARTAVWKCCGRTEL